MAINGTKSIVSVLVLLISLFLANIASANNITIIKEYTYMASDIDSKVSSRAIALEQVKRALLEQLGTYLISETEVKNFQMTKDQITTLTAGIVSAEVIDEKWDGRTYYLKAKITADTKEVAKSVDALRNDVQKSNDLEDSKKKAEEAIREVERLKKELELVKDDFKKQGEYANAISDLSATDWFDKGKAFRQANDLKDAIDAYDKAIELNSQYWKAYTNRGVVYSELGNYPQAIKDYDKAIGLNPKDEKAYNNRGLDYRSLGNHQQAIKDLNKAIKLNPMYADAYTNRGLVYSDLKKHHQAIKDYDKAIELNPKDATAYYCRGLAYDALGNNNRAIINFKIAAKLGREEAQHKLTSKGVEWQ